MMEDVLSFALAMVVAPFVDALAEQAPATCELARLVRLRMHATEIAQAGRDDGVGRDLDRNAALRVGPSARTAGRHWRLRPLVPILCVVELTAGHDSCSSTGSRTTF